MIIDGQKYTEKDYTPTLNQLWSKLPLIILIIAICLITGFLKGYNDAHTHAKNINLQLENSYKIPYHNHADNRITQSNKPIFSIKRNQK